MIKLHTYQEQMEHLNQDLLLLDKQHNSLSSLEQIGDILPAGLLVNDQFGRNFYMNKKSEDKLRYQREEINLLGEKYASTIIPDDNHRKYLQKQYELFFERNDLTEIHYLYQKVAPKNKEAEWMLTNSKLWKPNNKDNLAKRIIVVVCVNEMGECARRIGRVLDDNIYLRKYFKRFAALTKREKEIVALVAFGHNNPQIAGRLFISRHTVEQHRKNINRKLEFKTFRELIVFAEIFELI